MHFKHGFNYMNFAKIRLVWCSPKTVSQSAMLSTNVAFLAQWSRTDWGITAKFSHQTQCFGFCG